MAARTLTEAERAERFWTKVDRSGGPDACHPWLGSVSADGYARHPITGGSHAYAPREA